MRWIVEHGFLLFCLCCIVLFGIAVWLWAETLVTLRRVTRILEALAEEPSEEPSIVAATPLPPTVGIRPGSAIVSGVAVDRLPSARPAGGTAVSDGWVQR